MGFVVRWCSACVLSGTVLAWCFVELERLLPEVSGCFAQMGNSLGLGYGEGVGPNLCLPQRIFCFCGGCSDLLVVRGLWAGKAARQR